MSKIQLWLLWKQSKKHIKLVFNNLMKHYFVISIRYYNLMTDIALSRNLGLLFWIIFFKLILICTYDSSVQFKLNYSFRMSFSFLFANEIKFIFYTCNLLKILWVFVYYLDLLVMHRCVIKTYFLQLEKGRSANITQTWWEISKICISFCNYQGSSIEVNSFFL